MKQKVREGSIPPHAQTNGYHVPRRNIIKESYSFPWSGIPKVSFCFRRYGEGKKPRLDRHLRAIAWRECYVREKGRCIQIARTKRGWFDPFWLIAPDLVHWNIDWFTARGDFTHTLVTLIKLIPKSKMRFQFYSTCVFSHVTFSGWPITSFTTLSDFHHYWEFTLRLL